MPNRRQAIIWTKADPTQWPGAQGGDGWIDSCVFCIFQNLAPVTIYNGACLIIFAVMTLSQIYFILFCLCILFCIMHVYTGHHGRTANFASIVLSCIYIHVFVIKRIIKTVNKLLLLLVVVVVSLYYYYHYYFYYHHRRRVIIIIMNKLWTNYYYHYHYEWIIIIIIVVINISLAHPSQIKSSWMTCNWYDISYKFCQNSRFYCIYI